MLLEAEFVLTMSTSPSPSASRTAMPRGASPTVIACWGPNVPSPLPSSTETVLASMLATQMSAIPSRLKSAGSEGLARPSTGNGGSRKSW